MTERGGSCRDGEVPASTGTNATPWNRLTIEIFCDALAVNQLSAAGS
jgi:hypothetical protein